MAGALATAPLRTRRRQPGADAAIRLRVSHLVESVDFEPSELPPAAVLIVRRLADPMPRGLRTDPSSVVPATAWERAARSAIADIARHAARPLAGAVPSNAAAVLFADQSELLACLSRDLIHGAAASQWWWRAFLRSSSFSAIRCLLDAWRSNIRYLPSALTHLYSHREAATVLDSLTAAQAWSVLEDVARTFELKCVDAARALWPSSNEGPSSAANASNHTGAGSDQRLQEPQHNAEPQMTAPWTEALAYSPVLASLGPERASLLAICLLLCRSPRIVRSPKFSTEFARWYRPITSADSRAMQAPRRHTKAPEHAGPASSAPSEAHTADAAIRTRTPEASKTSLATNDWPSANHDLSPESIALTSSANLSNHAGRSEARALESKSEAVDSRSPQLPAPNQQADLRPVDGPIRPPQSGTNEPSPDTSAIQSAIAEASLPALAAQAAAAEIQKSLEAGQCIVTGLGGVFFLVNVLMALDLPQSIERECQHEFGLGSWEWIELIARCLLGQKRSALAADPIWALLTGLDGRIPNGRQPEQSAGTGFRAADCYRLPSAWLPEDLAATGRAQEEFRVNSRRIELHIQLSSGIGFPRMIRYFDRPPARSAIEQEMRQCFSREPDYCRLRKPDRRQGVNALDLAMNRPLRRFLAFLIPFLRWRIAASLGLRSEPVPDLTTSLLLRPAKVWATSTHVDLVMPLNQATAAVRCAGLDRDPGWVPELGRVIKFHFH